MNYKLAKELKESGFPQEKCSNVWKGRSVGMSTQMPLMIPSLSELIEACNPARFDDFGLSTGYTDQWEVWATYHGHAIPECDLKIKANSPEEAVAYLWLALNKKV